MSGQRNSSDSFHLVAISLSTDRDCKVVTFDPQKYEGLLLEIWPHDLLGPYCPSKIAPLYEKKNEHPYINMMIEFIVGLCLYEQNLVRTSLNPLTVALREFVRFDKEGPNLGSLCFEITTKIIDDIVGAGLFVCLAFMFLESSPEKIDHHLMYTAAVIIDKLYEKGIVHDMTAQLMRLFARYLERIFAHAINEIDFIQRLDTADEAYLESVKPILRAGLNSIYPKEQKSEIKDFIVFVVSVYSMWFDLDLGCSQDMKDPAQVSDMITDDRVFGFYITMVEKFRNRSPICATCGASAGKPRFKKCSGCRFERYCSRDCQLVVWPKHKRLCKRIQSIIGKF